MTKRPHQSAGTISGKPLFALGQVVTTRGAFDACPPDRLMDYLMRHSRGDSGIVCDEDAEQNRLAVDGGSRILSAYPIDPGEPCKGYGANTLWIITESDRSVTTFLLPSEY